MNSCQYYFLYQLQVGIKHVNPPPLDHSHNNSVERHTSVIFTKQCFLDCLGWHPCVTTLYSTYQKLHFSGEYFTVLNGLW